MKSSKVVAMRTAVTKNFHLPLPPDLYADLRAAAERVGTPATDVAREAIQIWLKQERRRQIHAELRAYAEVTAGSRDDFDPVVSAAGAQTFLAAHPHDDWSAEPGFPGIHRRSGRSSKGTPALARKPRTAPKRTSRVGK